LRHAVCIPLDAERIDFNRSREQER
jgi:hypothetical protein